MKCCTAPSLLSPLPCQIQSNSDGLTHAWAVRWLEQLLVDWIKMKSKESAEVSNYVCQKPTLRLECLKLKISVETLCKGWGFGYIHIRKSVGARGTYLHNEALDVFGWAHIQGKGIKRCMKDQQQIPCVPIRSWCTQTGTWSSWLSFPQRESTQWAPKPLCELNQHLPS